VAGELPLAIAGVAAAYYAGTIPDARTRSLVRWGGLALAGVAVFRLIRKQGSLLGGVVGELVPTPDKPGTVVVGGIVEQPPVSAAEPILSAPAPGEIIVTPKVPTTAYARIVEPPPDGEVALDFIGSTYSVTLEVTNPTLARLPAQEIEVQTQEHDSGFTSWDTSNKPINARTFVPIPALDAGEGWRGEVKLKAADTSFILPRSVFAQCIVAGKFSSSSYFTLKRWIGGLL
jgi:hypothetical protein